MRFFRHFCKTLLGGGAGPDFLSHVATFAVRYSKLFGTAIFSARQTEPHYEHALFQILCSGLL
jgi:hypothetical protein